MPSRSEETSNSLDVSIEWPVYEDERNKCIEEQMYKELCEVHELVMSVESLEQYVLRELRHLQEYLFHKFPPIAIFLRVCHTASA